MSIVVHYHVEFTANRVCRTPAEQGTCSRQRQAGKGNAVSFKRCKTSLKCTACKSYLFACVCEKSGCTALPACTVYKPDYRTECDHRRECSIVAIVITVGNSIPALCKCSNDGGIYGFA